jgi:allantoate deiminase
MDEQPHHFDVDPQTMARYVGTLGRCGETPEGGLIRYQYDDAWVQAQDVLRELMTEAGLDVHQDTVGNLFGTLAGTRPGDTVLTGSHVDTVRLGGRYDGALGVLGGIAALDALRQQAGQPRRTLQVVALCEEEASRFHANFFGTRAMLGLIDESEFDDLRDDDGVTLGEAMRRLGLDPGRFREARRTDLGTFLELHIEQGRRLYDTGIDIGVVTGITGISWQTITVTGRADHAGTTPMHSRRDAMRGAARMAEAVTRLAEELGDPAVATMGKWSVQPGGSNIVPEQVVFSVDARHPDQTVLDSMAEAIHDRCAAIAAELQLEVSVRTVKQEPPAPTDEVLQQVIADAADAHGASWQRMPSGAGHDSQVMSVYVPTGMIFVPSVDGASHTRTEYTTPEYCALGAAVLAGALHRLAY